MVTCTIRDIHMMDLYMLWFAYTDTSGVLVEPEHILYHTKA